MNYKAKSETLLTPHANQSQGDIQNLGANSDLVANVADAMLLQRTSDLAHIRQSQILQFQNKGWFVDSSSMERQFLAEGNGNSPPTPLPSSALNHAAGKGREDCEDDEEYGESDRDAASDVKAEVSEMESPAGDAKKEGRASPQQRPHAAVEKRYRQTVNSKLQQLYMSIPPSGKFSPDQRAGTGSNESDHAAKPVVLDKAIQYVQHLTETYLKYDADIEDVRRQLRDLAKRHGIDEHMLQQQDEN